MDGAGYGHPAESVQLLLAERLGFSSGGPDTSPDILYAAQSASGLYARGSGRPASRENIA